MSARSGVYEIVNTVNGKRYIGSTINLAKRWGAHQRQLRQSKHHSLKLQAAWVKHGETVFKFLPILTCQPSMLLFYEQQLLDKVKPEYNILPTAGSTLGAKRTAATCAKISASLQGNKNCLGVSPSVSTRAKIGAANAGRIPSVETRAKIGESSRGRKQSAETRAKKAVSMKGKNTGRRPPEVIAKISAALKGKKKATRTLAHRQNMSAAQKGRPKNPLSIARMSAAKKGKPWSAARRAAQKVPL